jgi:hypothetical protein
VTNGTRCACRFKISYQEKVGGLIKSHEPFFNQVQVVAEPSTSGLPTKKAKEKKRKNGE